MTNWNDTELNALVETVVRRATFDVEFRALAVNNPTQALQKFADKPVPEIAIRFVDLAGPVKTIVLPAVMYQPGELSEEELEHVAGGDDDEDPGDCTVTCCGTANCCVTCITTGTDGTA